MPLTVEQFAQRLTSSGVMSEVELRDWLAAIPTELRPIDGEALARELVQKKKLTKYQVDQIEAGNEKSLTLGNYVILDKLGQGGMGMVLKAMHRRMERVVAIKVMSPQGMQSPDAVQRFHREVKAAAKLNHPNIVAAHDADEANGTHFLVMEYVEGSDLSALVKARGPLPVEQAVQCILLAARGLEFAHKRGVIHRDIKPANLLLDYEGTVKILDMGLARIEDSVGGSSEGAGLTSTGTIMGTVDYMSPEQAMDTKSADARSDIYSLGCSLYYLVTGRCLYDGDTLMKKLMAHQTMAVPSLSEFGHNAVSASDAGSRTLDTSRAAVDSVFRQMVAKKPQDRPQSMTEVIALLEGCLSGEQAAIGSGRSGGSSTSVPGGRSSAGGAAATGNGLQDVLRQLGAESSSTTASLAASGGTPSGVTSSSVGDATLISASGDGEISSLGDKTQLLDQPGRPGGDRSGTAEGSKPAASTKRRTAWLVGSIAVAIAVLLAVVLARPEKTGTLVLEINDGEIEVTLGDTGRTVKGKSKHTLEVPLGALTLQVEREGLAFETASFDVPNGTPVSLNVAKVGRLIEVMMGDRSLGRFELTRGQTSPAMSPANVAQPVDGVPAAPQYALDFQAKLETGNARVELPSLLSPSEPCTVELSVTARSVPDNWDSLNLFIVGEGVQLRQQNRNWDWFTPGKDGTYDRVIVEGGVTVDRRTSLAGVSTGKELRLFIDGRLVGTTSLTGELGTTATPCLLGGLAADFEDWKPFDGLIDEVRISRTARYDQDFTPAPRLEADGDTLALYRFEEGAGDVLKDSSGNDHHGQIVGGKWVRLNGLPAKAAPSLSLSPLEILTSPDYEWSPPENLGTDVNTAADDAFPALSGDGLRLVFHSFGRAGNGLSEATRTRIDQPFGLAKPLGEEFSYSSAGFGTALSGDGLVLVFGSPRPGGLGEPGNPNLWQATRPDLSTPFSKPVCLTTISSGEADSHPSLSPDGLTIWFISDRPGGLRGGTWMSRRASREAEFAPPVPVELALLPGLEHYSHFSGVAVSSDERVLIFAPFYHFEGQGMQSLLMCTRPTRDAKFGTPVNIGSLSNSASYERTPALSADGTVLIFQSERPGGIGSTDLWTSRRVRKTRGSTPPAETMDPARSPSVDLLHHPVVEQFAQEAKGLRLEKGALVFTSSEADGLAQVWVDKLKTRHGRVRAVLQALDPLPQGVVSIGWDYAGGNPRRIDAVLHAPQGKPAAAVWEFGPNFDVTPLVDEPMEVDLSQPIVIEHEFGEGLIRATIAGRTITSKLSAASDRQAFPYLGVKGTWKLTEWRMEDLEGAESPAVAGAPLPAIAPFDAEQAKAHQAAWAKHLGVPVEYTNSLGMKFVLIPPGEFLMGSSPEEIEEALELSADDKSWHDAIRSSGPQHKVILTKPFYLGVHEVTQRIYEAIMGKNPSSNASTGVNKDFVTGRDTTEFPVEGVTWNDCAEFCTKVSEQEGLQPFYVRTGESVKQMLGTGYRLPTEAEWEFACRAGTATKFWSGDQTEALKQTDWFRENSGNPGHTHAVGGLKANPLGLFDLHGNASEFVHDEWSSMYYEQFIQKPAIDPGGPPALDHDSWRVWRGGTLGSYPVQCWSSKRAAIPAVQSAAHLQLGFRVALTTDAVRQAIARQPPRAVTPFDAAQARAHQEAWAKSLGVPVVYTNSIGMKFVLIPPGEFLMGSSPEEVDAVLKPIPLTEAHIHEKVRVEAPQRRVVLTEPFYLGVHEVTQQQYAQLVGINPSHFAESGKGSGLVQGLDTKNHPVESVSWLKATSFCTLLSKKERWLPWYGEDRWYVPKLSGTGYRLPTDAEWEFACRAGTTTTYWSGAQPDDARHVAWCSLNAQERTHSVGELPANPFGLHDMHGNVWEFVEDGWPPSPNNGVPNDGVINPITPYSQKQYLAIRGGSWSDPPDYLLRSANHEAFRPEDAYPMTGMRLALSVDAIRPLTKIDRPVAGSPGVSIRTVVRGFEVVTASYRARVTSEGLLGALLIGDTPLIDCNTFRAGVGGMGVNGTVRIERSGTQLKFTQGSDYSLVYEFDEKGFTVVATLDAIAAGRDQGEGKAFYLTYSLTFSDAVTTVRSSNPPGEFNLPTAEQKPTLDFVATNPEGHTLSIQSPPTEAAFGYSGAGPRTWSHGHLVPGSPNSFRFDIRKAVAGSVRDRTETPP